MKMIFHFHANKTHFRNKGCVLGLILKVRVFGTRKWPIEADVGTKAQVLLSFKSIICALWTPIISYISFL